MAVTVIDIRSLSYTGTTWLNLLAGSHDGVFTLVLPQRVYAALRGEVEPAAVCMLHRADCPFWPSAIADFDLDENLYVQIAERAQKSVLAINNPFVDPRGVTDLNDDRCRVRKVTVVREGRSTVASYLSRHPESAPKEAIEWLVANRGLAEPAPGEHALRVRYEDVAADQATFLSDLGAFVGLDYDTDSAKRFWEHEHHPAGGNPGPLAMIRRHLSGHASDEAVEARYRRVVADPTDVSVSERWRETLDRSALQLFDRLAGAVNREWGYQ